ncbi:MAG: hypothetical protein V1909_04565, partial [Candidatus Micrarchaeota archaeon]
MAGVMEVHKTNENITKVNTPGFLRLLKGGNFVLLGQPELDRGLTDRSSANPFPIDGETRTAAGQNRILTNLLVIHSRGKPFGPVVSFEQKSGLMRRITRNEVIIPEVLQDKIGLAAVILNPTNFELYEYTDKKSSLHQIILKVDGLNDPVHQMARIDSILTQINEGKLNILITEPV